VKLSSSKRALLKKNVFESDKSVSNGKSETENQVVSRGANPNAGMTPIKQSVVVEYEEEPSTNLENEMRETSYFK
jgi:hypothetical protein